MSHARLSAPPSPAMPCWTLLTLTSTSWPRSDPTIQPSGSASYGLSGATGSDRPRLTRESRRVSPAARALRSDVVRRATSRGGMLQCAEAHALPTMMSISPTPLIDYANMAGCGGGFHSRHLLPNQGGITLCTRSPWHLLRRPWRRIRRRVRLA